MGHPPASGKRECLTGFQVAPATVVAQIVSRQLSSRSILDIPRALPISVEIYMSSQSLETALKDIQDLVSILAVFFAAAWGYFKYFRGRAFKPRLEVSIDGKISEEPDRLVLIICVRIKNVGLVKVDIESKLSALSVSANVEEPPIDIIRAIWRHLGSFRVTEENFWLEPGETEVIESLYWLSDTKLKALRLEVTAGAARSIWKSASILVVSPATTSAP